MISKHIQKIMDMGEAFSEVFAEGAKLKEADGAENVFDFGIGNPNVKAPAIVNETAIRLLRDMDSLAVHSYTDTSGLPAARRKIAASLNRRFGTDYNEKNILMTVGAAGGLNVMIRTLMDADEEILTIAPYFSEYDCYAANAGVKIAAVPPNTVDFMPNLELFEQMIHEKTKMVLINTPNNPSGVVYSLQTLQKMAEILEKKQAEYGTTIYLISDEPYRELVYDGATCPWVPNIYRNTIVAYSFSKSLSLPGDRIGYLTIPSQIDDFEEVVTAASVANRTLGFINAPALQQMVVAECCDEQTDVSYYDGNRELLYRSLTEMGYECIKPQGAFYLFVKALEEDDRAFCKKAREHKLLLTMGIGFRCPGYVRISYCVSREMIEKALPAFRALAQEYQK